jgi:hypothetical protein
MAFFDKLFVAGFKYVQVKVFTRIYYNAKRKYGNEVCHSDLQFIANY